VEQPAPTAASIGRQVARLATQFAIHIHDMGEWGRLVGLVRQRLRLTTSA
jgi:hypothetical protein